MSAFIGRLEHLNESDSKVRAVLRRSLAFDPGTHVPAFPIVEPFVGKDSSPRRREMLYLVAGLWAAHWKAGRSGDPISIGRACARYQLASGSSSVERRFIALLDADDDQLPHRLRQMIALLKESSLDFESLLSGLLYWNDPQKRTQNRWAREFYQNLDSEASMDTELEQENIG